MQSIDVSSIDKILEGWDKLLKEYPQMKRELLEDLGQRMLADVQGAIGGTGTVQSWQARYTGSRNGYVAVRPRANTFQTTKGGTRYAVGYVTNAIENGHRHRRPEAVRRDGYTYRPRIHTPAVAGRHFYAQVRGRLGSFGRAELERLALEVARRLEGGT